tara:strand:- start:2306 stop:2524 length:219 start_codon:yes stop_codon:yes gene_type:complete
MLYKYNVIRSTDMSDIQITMMSIPDLAKAWGCSRNFLWGRCKSGDIPSTKIGDRWFIPTWWIKEQEAVDAKL